MISSAPLTSIPNFREMGGLPAREGRLRMGALYRSGHLAKASDKDLNELIKLGVKRIIDFRTDYDQDADGGADNIPIGVSYLRLPLPDVSGRQAEMRTLLVQEDASTFNVKFGRGVALDIATSAVAVMADHPSQRQVFGEFIRLVAAEPKVPILWHCSAGKDRAGWAATLLGITLGVPDDVLIQHYLESNANPRLQSFLDHCISKGINPDAIRPLIFVHSDYIQAGFDAIDTRWNSRDEYLQIGLGLSDTQIRKLRNHLIT